MAVANPQQQIINALQNEIRWLEQVIFNPGLNELDMRLLVTNTPREVRMGYTCEVPERKIFLPAQAEEVHANPKTVSTHLRKLEKAGAFSYRSEMDPTSGNTRVYLAPLPVVENPEMIQVDRKPRGGSVWQDGKRIKRCGSCGSANLLKRTQIQCGDCGSAINGEWKAVNDQGTDSHIDTESPDAREADSENFQNPEQEEDDPDSHIDGGPSDDEISNCPSSTCTQRGDDDDTEEEITVTASVEVVNLTGHHATFSLDQLDQAEAFIESVTPDSHIDGGSQPASAAEELQSLKQWIVWRYGPHRPNGKRDKLPFSALSASPMKYPIDVTDPAFWATYAQAQAIYEQSQSWKLPYDGVGFCFRSDGGIVGIDQDGLLTPIIESYSERSVSGDGLHTFVHGSIPRNIKRDDLGIEMYDHDRYFTWTGDHLPDTPIFIADLQGELDTLFADIAPTVGTLPPTVNMTVGPAPTDSDDAIIEKAKNAANGAKFTKLWNGDYSDYLHKDGSPDHSQGDLALCRLLAFWTGRHIPTMDRLFRASGLMRPKWDNPARSGETYGQGTLRRALIPMEVAA